MQIEGLAPVVVQHAQHRFTRMSESCNCLLGILLAAATLLGRSYMSWASIQRSIWTSGQIWQHMLLIALSALYAGLIGWMLQAAWTRLRLMRVLHGLRHQLVTGKVTREPARYAGRVSAEPAAMAHAHTADGAGTQDSRAPHSLPRHQRPRVVVRNAPDKYRLAIHLFTHWTLPRVEIGIEGAAQLDVQRAQHRIAQLSQTCNCVLAACLAAATLLVGSTLVVWKSNAQWQWWAPVSWGPLGSVLVATLCAALLGMTIEMIWTRVRVMLALHGVRHRLGT
jgi:hypothetical protein